jgi:hypothetical protein
MPRGLAHACNRSPVQLEKETKGALRYQEVDEKGEVIEQAWAKIGTLYVRKRLNEALAPEVPATSRRIAMDERPDPPHVQFGGPGLATGNRQPRCR